MRRLSQGTEYCDEQCTNADQKCAHQRVSCKRFTEDQSSKDGVEDETGLKRGS